MMSQFNFALADFSLLGCTTSLSLFSFTGCPGSPGCCCIVAVSMVQFSSSRRRRRHFGVLVPHRSGSTKQKFATIKHCQKEKKEEVSLRYVLPSPSSVRRRHLTSLMFCWRRAKRVRAETM